MYINVCTLAHPIVKAAACTVFMVWLWAWLADVYS